jgi:regulator of sirC expression with transglutaminase-like and TPR domain
MQVRELWSAADGDALRALLAAVRADDLEAALLAIEQAPEHLAHTTRRQLDLWAVEVRATLEGDDPGRRTRAMQTVLGTRHGLEGDTERYHHPRNSRITQVVRRRRGLPILLAAVWMSVGRRAGVPVSGVGLPGHFIVRIDGGPLVDPFRRGAALTPARCREIVEEVTNGKLDWRPEFLEDTPIGSLVERVLRNLLGSWTRAGRLEEQYRIARMMAGLRPDDPGARLTHARVADEIGARALAEELYEAIARQFAGSEAAARARNRLDAMARSPRLLN